MNNKNLHKYIKRVKMYKVLIFMISVCLLQIISGTANAQNGNATVILLQGKVTDQNGQIVSTTISFRDINGKKMSTKTNSKDGSFQQIMTPGMTYSVLFKDYMVLGEEYMFTLPMVKEYTEMSQNFKVKKIETGLELMRFKAFNPNQSELTGTYKQYFEDLKDFLNNNIKASVILTIHTHDSQFKETTKNVQVADKKGKMKTKKEKITVSQQLEQLANSRIEAIKSHFKSIGLPEKKITFEKDLASDNAKAEKPKKDSKKKGKEKPAEAPKSANIFNVNVKVGKIANL